ncbi:MAG: ribosome recycling factor [Patulibacter sp.]|nr:ribosome recycling factor [Patulibacter sp.]MDO9410524.1 ribosome recycling factor [Patulibacter sp.]
MPDDSIIDELLADAAERMKKAVEQTSGELATVRTGRASPNLLDRVVVDYHGVPTALRQLAQIGAPEARLLTVQPYDPSSIKQIEKAISDGDLGVTPSNDGKVIRLGIPEMTEERRKEMVKTARKIGEEGRIRVRNVRRDVLSDLRTYKTDGDIGADDEHRAEAELQKVTDEAIAGLDAQLKAKEADVLEV